MLPGNSSATGAGPGTGFRCDPTAEKSEKNELVHRARQPCEMVEPCSLRRLPGCRNPMHGQPSLGSSRVGRERQAARVVAAAAPAPRSIADLEAAWGFIWGDEAAAAEGADEEMLNGMMVSRVRMDDELEPFDFTDALDALPLDVPDAVRAEGRVAAAWAAESEAAELAAGAAVVAPVPVAAPVAAAARAAPAAPCGLKISTNPNGMVPVSTLPAAEDDAAEDAAGQFVGSGRRSRHGILVRPDGR